MKKLKNSEPKISHEETRSTFLERFDKFSGLVKYKCSISNDWYYVVYGFYFDGEPDNQELGDALGKGITKEEAYIDAIKNLVDIRRATEKQISDFVENVNFKLYSPQGKLEKIIIPFSDLEVTYDVCGETCYSRSKEKFHNATLYYNPKNGVYAADI